MLGEAFGELKNNNEKVYSNAHAKNNWFTPENIDYASSQWQNMLEKPAIEKWLSAYNFDKQRTTKSVGIIAAGNIPWVALHDVICAVVCGHKVFIKLSSADEVLMTWAIKTINQIVPETQAKIEICESLLPHLDAIIATGSNNSARYFEYYFRNIPKIIRKNRSSVALLSNEMTELEMELLGKDIFTYFGLGCRSVSKLFIPTGFNLVALLDVFNQFEYLTNHHKFYNNYIYHKALMLMNLDKHLDNGFITILASKSNKAPLGQLFYEYYDDASILINDLSSNDQIQCVVGNNDGLVKFGMSQKPKLWDYADNLDTINFLK